MIKLAIDFDCPSPQWWESGGRDLWESILEGFDNNDVLLDDPIAESWLVAASMIEGLEEGWAAHRVGHVVFTYSVVDLRSAQDPELWVFVYWPDPNGGPWEPEFGGDGAAVWHASGVGLRVTGGDFDAALEAQNTLRAAHGLAALPHPFDVVMEGVPVDVLDGGE